MALPGGDLFASLVVVGEERGDRVVAQGEAGRPLVRAYAQACRPVAEGR
ncbi:hypothetical protein ACF1BS_18405 [Streptomyces sp. NPDC014748]